jgi:excisionase family DNA binding protein
VPRSGAALDTQTRFVRRLIAERRIGFVRVGRHVWVSESALADFIEAGKVRPLEAAGQSRWKEVA